MLDGEIPIRRAVTADAAAIAAIHVRAWRSAYRGILPDDLLDGLSIERRAAQWLEWLDGDPAPTFTLVAEAGRAVVGFCALRTPSPDEDLRPATAEVGALYVEPSQRRTRIGTNLLEAALAELRSAAWQRASLWVFEANSTATSFYTGFGFSPDGATRRAHGDPLEIRMRLPL